MWMIHTHLSAGISIWKVQSILPTAPAGGERGPGGGGGGGGEYIHTYQQAYQSERCSLFFPQL